MARSAQAVRCRRRSARTPPAPSPRPARRPRPRAADRHRFRPPPACTTPPPGRAGRPPPHRTAAPAHRGARAVRHPDRPRRRDRGPRDVRRRPASRCPRPTRTRVFTVANQKGGVGKTTTTVNVAAALALHGLRRAGHRPRPAGQRLHRARRPAPRRAPRRSTTSWSTARPLAEVVQPAEGVAEPVLRARHDRPGRRRDRAGLAGGPRVPAAASDRRLRRRRSSEPLDYVLIDCPPSLGLLTVNAFVAAEEVLIPIQCEYYALEGLGQLLRNVELVKAHLNPRPATSRTILLTMYDGRTRLAAQVADEVREHFGDVVLRTAIPRSVRISEAPSYEQTVITYDPGSTGALSYLEAAREIALAADVSPRPVGADRRRSRPGGLMTADKRRGLGRGLGALIPTAPSAPRSRPAPGRGARAGRRACRRPAERRAAPARTRSRSGSSARPRPRQPPRRRRRADEDASPRSTARTSPSCRSTSITPEPAPAAHRLRRGGDGRARPLDPRDRAAAAGRRARGRARAATS